MLKAAIALVYLTTAAAHAAPYVFYDGVDGISGTYFDVGLGIRWPRGRPEGADDPGSGGPPRPYASHRIEAGDSRRVLRLDVTAMVREWWRGTYVNDGMLVQLSEGEFLTFHAREDVDPTLRPQLILTFADGHRRFLEPQADAALDSTSDLGLGTRPLLLLKGSSPLAVRFDLSPWLTQTPPTRAELVLVRSPGAGTSRATLIVRRLVAPTAFADAAPDQGIARRYVGDTGIASDVDVLFADGFDAVSLDPRWTRGMAAPSARIRIDDERRFVPLSGPALRITIPKGRQLGLDLRYRLKRADGSEPDEVYFRYYLWLSRDWLNSTEGGKLPGLAGTYGKAAWGDRPWDGQRGWSMRGAYRLPPANHPAHGRVMLGSYAYHAQAARDGEFMPWPGGAFAALVEPERWYCIEQHMRMNSPGREDGLFEVWVDGRPVLTRDRLRLRDTATIHIEEVWMNFFHGGGGVPPTDIHAYIDSVVVARRYIGPMVTR